MEKLEVSTYAEICNYLGGFPNSNGRILYRGISSEFKLLPTLGYETIKLPEEYLNELGQIAQTMFNEYYKTKYPENKRSINQLIYLGRHYGLISPYYDFTFDITIAIQFGIEMSQGSNLHLYSLITHGIQRVRSEVINETEYAILLPTPYYGADETAFGERTQIIQSSKLLHQPTKEIRKPLTDKLGEKIIRFEVDNSNFGSMCDEIKHTTDNLMTTDLLIDKNSQVRQDVEAINARAIEQVRLKYDI